MSTTRITANAAVTGALSLFVDGVTASAESRTLGGGLVRYGVYGRTSRGRLKVRAGALRFPDDLTRVKLTEEHNRDKSRGHLRSVTAGADGIRVLTRVSDGPLGDAALQEAADHTRDAFSFDIVDARIEGDEITDGLVIAIGQVGIPAYDDMRIDTIAASITTPEGPVMTPEQIARLAALRAQETRTDAEETELGLLAQLEAAQPAVQQAAQPAAPAAPAAPSPAASVAASAAPQAAVLASIGGGGTPTPTSSTTTSSRGALDAFISTIVNALQPGGGGAQAITAALADVTHGDHTDIIEAPAWSGELWSGLQYEPEFTPLLNSGSLTNWEGRGWRFTGVPEMQDYAGDKAAIPTGEVTTEPSTYEAARMAVGVDVDRKFYDFPNAAFLAALFERVRETWAIKLDGKVRAYIVANAVAATGPDGADVDTDPDVLAETTVLKAAARAVLTLKRRRVGRATFVAVNDEDLFSLMDVTELDLPAFLDLYGIEPRNFVSSPNIASGTVIAGVRQAATVRTLPGSPIRVSAQHLANGGVDEAFFGYWAIEEHHTSGIASVQFNRAG